MYLILVYIIIIFILFVFCNKLVEGQLDQSQDISDEDLEDLYTKAYKNKYTGDDISEVSVISTQSRTDRKICIRFHYHLPKYSVIFACRT